jgi:hypothetical protein
MSHDGEIIAVSRVIERQQLFQDALVHSRHRERQGTECTPVAESNGSDVHHSRGTMITDAVEISFRRDCRINSRRHVLLA